MKFIKTIIILILINLANVSYSQNILNNVVELSIDNGFANDLGTLGTYKRFNFPEDIEIDSRRSARTKNITFSFTRYLYRRNGIKISFGHSEYGFDFDGKTETSRVSIKDFYRATYLEWGISYIHRVPISMIINLLLEPGIRYHSDADTKSSTINFLDKDSYSISSYMGLEIPMIGERFFANLGLQFKLPLHRYDYSFNSTQRLYPYFIGIKIGLNYQF